MKSKNFDFQADPERIRDLVEIRRKIRVLVEKNPPVDDPESGF
jgi:hypothetical protein